MDTRPYAVTKLRLQDMVGYSFMSHNVLKDRLQLSMFSISYEGRLASAESSGFP
jgi:hypothetical protein